MKRPSFQFYPADWRKDPGLRACSIGARGVMIEIMAIAHECDPYGHLTLNGSPMTVAMIAQLIGVSRQQAAPLIAELKATNVISALPDGTLFSRRMVRDEQKRKAIGANGILGADHGQKGAIYGNRGGRPRKSITPLKPGSSSSSSTSSSLETSNTDADASGGFDEFWHLFPRRTAKRAAQKSYRGAIARGADPVQILTGAKRYAAERQGQDERYTKHPSTWLNGDCWADGAPVGNGVASQPQSDALSADEDWRWATRAWRRWQAWNYDRGPNPDQPGCRVPPAILAEFPPGWQPPPKSTPPSPNSNP